MRPNGTSVGGHTDCTTPRSLYNLRIMNVRPSRLPLAAQAFAGSSPVCWSASAFTLSVCLAVGSMARAGDPPHRESGSRGDPGPDLYVSADQGSDANPGTEEQPYKTLGKAVSALGPGGTLHVMSGTYYETLEPPSGAPSKRTRVVAYQGHVPVISGAQRLQAEWRVHRGHIYCAPYHGKAFSQLFVDGKMMTTARWPNASSDPDRVFDGGRAMTSAGDRASISDPHLPDGDWVGGKIAIWPGAAWISFVREIKQYQPGKSLSVTRDFVVEDPHAEDRPYCPKAGNSYFLFGKLAGLNAPNEWVRENSTLYLYAPDGQSPQEHTVEYRVRDYGVNLKGKAYVEVSGLTLFAAAITMENATHCVINACNQKYHEHFEDGDGYRATFVHHLNYVSGCSNVWQNSEIAYAAGDGLRLDGSRNIVTNMLIHDVDYSGGWFAGVMGQPGRNQDGVPDAANTHPKILSTCDHVTVTHCTIFNCGRNAILHHKTGRFDILYNDLSQASKMVRDCGLTSTFGTDGRGSVIAYNWLHDNVGTYTAGVYLDCYNENFVVHHNVIWNCSWAGIQLNGYSRGNVVYNNTIWGCGAAFMTYSYPGDVPDQSGTRVFNNLYAGKASFVSGRLGPWQSHNLQADVLKTIDANYVPRRGGSAVDVGAVAPGIENLYKGKAPDVGAYEYGGDPWRAGRE